MLGSPGRKPLPHAFFGDPHHGLCQRRHCCGYAATEVQKCAREKIRGCGFTPKRPDSVPRLSLCESRQEKTTVSFRRGEQGSALIYSDYKDAKQVRAAVDPQKLNRKQLWFARSRPPKRPCYMSHTKPTKRQRGD